MSQIDRVHARQIRRGGGGRCVGGEHGRGRCDERERGGEDEGVAAGPVHGRLLLVGAAEDELAVLWRPDGPCLGISSRYRGGQAGAVRNYVQAYQITTRREYLQVARSVISYVETTLLDPESGAFFGSQSTDEEYYKLSPSERIGKSAPPVPAAPNAINK